MCRIHRKLFVGGARAGCYGRHGRSIPSINAEHRTPSTNDPMRPTRASPLISLRSSASSICRSLVSGKPPPTRWSPAAGRLDRLQRSPRVLQESTSVARADQDESVKSARILSCPCPTPELRNGQPRPSSVLRAILRRSVQETLHDVTCNVSCCGIAPANAR